MIEKPKRTKKPAKKKVKKLTVTKVQDAVNKAIRERDGCCVVRDGRHECAGCLTASHFYPKGGCSAFRFYPPNINTQCLGHHGIHERRQDPFFYKNWMDDHYPEAMELMECRYHASIKYDQITLAEIMAMAKAGRLNDLEAYIRGLIEASIKR